MIEITTRIRNRACLLLLLIFFNEFGLLIVGWRAIYHTLNKVINNKKIKIKKKRK